MECKVRRFAWGLGLWACNHAWGGGLRFMGFRPLGSQASGRILSASGGWDRPAGVEATIFDGLLGSSS